MKFYQFTEDLIQDAATKGMQIGIEQLIVDGLIVEEIGLKFINSHAVAIVTDDNFLSRFKKFFKKDAEKGTQFFTCITINTPNGPTE